MCKAKAAEPLAPPPAPPPVLEQSAPKSSRDGDDDMKRKRNGLSNYKVKPSGPTSTNKLGGIPTKKGVVQ